MNDLIKKVKHTIKNNNLIEPGDKIVLAVSGGPDSICMLDVIYKIVNLNPEPTDNYAKIVVAHVNHMIREEAADDEDFVRDFCKKIGVEFYSKSIDVKKLANNKKIGLEEAGRKARYDFFDEIANLTHANKIAIAHNKNDSVETVIMHALRGSGTYGLHGIEAKNGKYIRPLIECERHEIEEYCKDNDIQARIDKTNLENEYTRNKIRNIVLPYIKKEFNPNITETICRLSDVLKDQDDFIETIVRNSYAQMVLNESNNEIVLDLKKFNLQEKVIKSRLVLYTINRLFGTTNGIEKIHIDDILKLCQNNVGNKYLMPNKNTKVYVKSRKTKFL